jgi:hypothetical protein
MNKARVATQDELRIIGDIASFAGDLLWRNGHVLLDTGDGALLNFVTDDELGEDEVLTWCFASTSLCVNHEVSFESRKAVLESLGLKYVSRESGILTYEGELIVDSIDSDFRRLILAGFESGETNLKSIEVNSVNHESELFQIQTYKFLSDELKGGE